MSTTPDEPPVSPQQGISLQELSQAFARALGGMPETQSEASTPAERAPSGPLAAESQPELPLGGPIVGPPALDQGPGAVDDPCQISPRTILEALLFVGNRQSAPLGSQQAAELMRGVKAEEIPTLVDELNQRYEESGCPLQIVCEASGYRMVLRREFNAVRNKFSGRVREARLSQAAIDILAIIAYKQPLTADEVSRLRGKPSSRVLSQLVRRQLLRIERSEENPRRPLYYTTNRFLALFGLESLEDLPQSEEIEKR